MVRTNDYTKQNTTIKQILSKDMLPLFNSLGLNPEETNKKNPDLTRVISDLSYVTFDVSDDDVVRCLLEYLTSKVAISLDTIATISKVNQTDIQRFMDGHEISIHQKYQLICHVYRLTNIINTVVNEPGILKD